MDNWGEVMTGPQVDYTALYRQLRMPVLALTPEFRIADANEAYLEAMGRTREDLLGRDAFDAFPDNPSDPRATGVRNSIASLRRVLATGRPDAVEFQNYDVEIPDYGRSAGADILSKTAGQNGGGSGI